MRVAGRLGQVDDDEVHALRRQPFGDPRAYPVRTSGYQSGHPVEFHGGIVGRGTDIPFWSRP